MVKNKTEKGDRTTVGKGFLLQIRWYGGPLQRPVPLGHDLVLLGRPESPPLHSVAPAVTAGSGSSRGPRDGRGHRRGSSRSTPGSFGLHTPREPLTPPHPREPSPPCFPLSTW